MSDLKNAILDAKYIDMVSLADFIVRDCDLPDSDSDGTPLAQQNEIAAAIFRWAAMQAGRAAETDGDADETDELDAAPILDEAEAVKPRAGGPTRWPNMSDMPTPVAKGEDE